MKTFFALLVLLLMSLSAHASSACITNVTLVATCGSFVIEGGTNSITSATGIPVTGDDCETGYMVTFTCPCSSSDHSCAVLSWSCNGICGTGGSRSITMPAGAQSITIAFFYGDGCDIAQCEVFRMICSQPPPEQ